MGDSLTQHLLCGDCEGKAEWFFLFSEDGLFSHGRSSEFKCGNRLTVPLQGQSATSAAARRQWPPHGSDRKWEQRLEKGRRDYNFIFIALVCIVVSVWGSGSHNRASLLLLLLLQTVWRTDQQAAWGHLSFNRADTGSVPLNCSAEKGSKQKIWANDPLSACRTVHCTAVYRAWSPFIVNNLAFYCFFLQRCICPI